VRLLLPDDIDPMRDPRVATEPGAEPVEECELGGLFDALARYRLVVLAVSGGADSMALMVLFRRWLELGRSGRPAVEVVTVDHGLRPSSAEEARFVEERARGLGFPHTTLAWSGDKPRTGVQEAAREARYRLLGAHARVRALAPAAIATAHTEDDQAETLLMRLARGSGIDGLSAMAHRRPLAAHEDVDLVRPLLGLGRDRLVATLKARGVEWLEDPSNASLDFERVRLRAARADLEALGLTSPKLALSARRLERARAALDEAAGGLAAAAVDLNGGIFAAIDRVRFRAAAPELAIRLLSHVLEAFGGEARPAGLGRVEALAEQLSGVTRVAVTLGGCIVRAGSREIRVLRECAPEELPELALDAGSSAVWDGRFRVEVAPGKALKARGIAGPVLVRALGARAYATLKPQIEPADRPPLRAAESLPSFWANGELLAVPQLALAGTLEVRARSSRDALGQALFKSEFIGWTRGCLRRRR
jgi:tRNA(Ile)-lysidine synthase